MTPNRGNAHVLSEWEIEWQSSGKMSLTSFNAIGQTFLFEFMHCKGQIVLF